MVRYILKEDREYMPRETLVNEMIDDMLDSIIIIKLNTYFNTKR